MTLFWSVISSIVNNYLFVLYVLIADSLIIDSAKGIYCITKDSLPPPYIPPLCFKVAELSFSEYSS